MSKQLSFLIHVISNIFSFLLEAWIGIGVLTTLFFGFSIIAPVAVYFDEGFVPAAILALFFWPGALLTVWVSIDKIKQKYKEYIPPIER